jgi:putative phosphoesterase
MILTGNEEVPGPFQNVRCETVRSDKNVTEYLRVGVISDTHGLLRAEALAALQGVDHIIHAGDIGSPDILSTLGTVAPVTAVRGNTDRGPWLRGLPAAESLALGFLKIYVIHNVWELDLDPRARGFAAVVAGHSHQPMNELRDGVLFFNPGSAGPRRFHLPVALGFLSIQGKSLCGEILVLEA